jgi:hypothetical protein
VRPVRPVFTGAGGAVDFDSLRGVFFMSDLREAVKALIAASESCDIDRGTGSWAPDDAWSTLVDALEDDQEQGWKFVTTTLESSAERFERLLREYKHE